MTLRILRHISSTEHAFYILAYDILVEKIYMYATFVLGIMPNIALICIMQTCPCHVDRLTSHFYLENGMNRGIHYFSFFCSKT